MQVSPHSKNPFQLLTAEEIAPALSMNLQQVWRLQRLGRIPSTRLGHRTLRFNLEEVQKALTAQSKPCSFTQKKGRSLA